MKYFSYGSNMSLARLHERAPSARIIGTCSISRHDLRFHKKSKDNSGKCDAYETGDVTDVVFGVLFDIDGSEKSALDRAEGLGYGYNEKKVSVTNNAGESCDAVTYYATNIDKSLKPYSWYKKHVVIGAKASNLPQDYVKRIEAVESIKDPDKEREAKQLAIHS